MKAPGALHHTWQCQRCAHALYDHDLYRNPTPSATRNYLHGRCLVPGCFCEQAVTAYLGEEQK